MFEQLNTTIRNTRLTSLIKLCRPEQYIKNIFIFIPLFFAGKVTDIGLFSSTFLAFIAFSISSSAVYIFNDIMDLEDDKQHPNKKNRPLASGDIHKYHANVLMIVMLIIGSFAMALISMKATIFLACYFLINILYSSFLKKFAIVDVNIIAIGFILRLFIGSAVTNIDLNEWIIIMTFLLALFMALAKRRDDVIIFLDTGKVMRKALNGYNLQFLDTAMSIMASVVIVSYTIYVSSPELEEKFNSSYLYLTTFFVILGIMRYLKIAFLHRSSGSPTKILRTDLFMQLTLIGWMLTFSFILY